MNAYELSNKLENKDRLWSIDEKLMLNTCKMLRQQADRIEELEKSSMAWYEAGKFVSPQLKELSDEEIDEVLYSMDWAHDPVKFARAILKKASEK